MNRIKAILTLSVAMAALAVSAPVLAWGHARLSFGVVIGAPFYPWYYPPYYTYPPYPAVVAVPAAPTTYVEKGASSAPSQRSAYWYYCEASKTFYPYVKECPAGWMRVVPQATPPAARTAPRATPPTAPQVAPQTAQR